MNTPLPLSKRPLDIAILIFFFVNISFITYIVDLEQLVIPEPPVQGESVDYPFWPPPFLVDVVHWWAFNFDELQRARPMWWKMTIWIDVLFFGPFYILGIYAFIRGRNWIRIPSIIYSTMLFTNVTIILGEEFFGPHASTSPLIVFLANAPWLFYPIIITLRMAFFSHPFNQPLFKKESRKELKNT